MPTHEDSPDADGFVAEARREQAKRAKGYRERALKMYPWVCGRCGRDFAGKSLRQLTVHHKDHDHDNNPADGSNWELLCLYCHDEEHSRRDAARADTEPTSERKSQASTYKPFAGLEGLLKSKK